MATTAIFSSATGQLAVPGDAIGNTIVTSRDAAGRILVNGRSMGASSLAIRGLRRITADKT